MAQECVPEVQVRCNLVLAVHALGALGLRRVLRSLVRAQAVHRVVHALALQDLYSLVASLHCVLDLQVLLLDRFRRACKVDLIAQLHLRKVLCDKRRFTLAVLGI